MRSMARRRRRRGARRRENRIDQGGRDRGTTAATPLQNPPSPHNHPSNNFAPSAPANTPRTAAPICTSIGGFRRIGCGRSLLRRRGLSRLAVTFRVTIPRRNAPFKATIPRTTGIIPIDRSVAIRGIRRVLKRRRLGILRSMRRSRGGRGRESGGIKTNLTIKMTKRAKKKIKKVIKRIRSKKKMTTLTAIKAKIQKKAGNVMKNIDKRIRNKQNMTTQRWFSSISRVKEA